MVRAIKTFLLLIVIPVACFAQPANLTGIKVNNIRVIKQIHGKNSSITTSKPFEFLVKKKLNDYGIFDTTFSAANSKFFNVQVHYLIDGKTSLQVFMVLISVQSYTNEDGKPDIVYFQTKDFGYTFGNDVEEYIESSIKEQVNYFVKCWVDYNK